MIKILTEDRINMRDDEHEIYKDPCPNCCSLCVLYGWNLGARNVEYSNSRKLDWDVSFTFLLSLKVLPVKWFDLGAETLVAIMPFLLIPPTLGLMNYGSFFMSKGISLFITVVASTFLIIIVAGHTGQYLANRKERES